MYLKALGSERNKGFETASRLCKSTCLVVDDGSFVLLIQFLLLTVLSCQAHRRAKDNNAGQVLNPELPAHSALRVSNACYQIETPRPEITDRGVLNLSLVVELQSKLDLSRIVRIVAR